MMEEMKQEEPLFLLREEKRYFVIDRHCFQPMVQERAPTLPSRGALPPSQHSLRETPVQTV